VMRRPRSRRVRFAPKADKEQIVSVCLLSAIRQRLDTVRSSSNQRAGIVN
jgi:hypothetical protein